MLDIQVNEVSKKVKCDIDILGVVNPYDPAEREPPQRVSCNMAISPNGKRVLIHRERGGYYIVNSAKKEYRVTVDGLKGKVTDIKGMLNTGVCLFTVNNEHFLDRQKENYSLRPLIVDSGTGESIVLGPEYMPSNDVSAESDQSKRPLSHIPICFTSNGYVFGKTEARFQAGRSEGSREGRISYCLWKKQGDGKWILDYLLPLFDDRELFATYYGNFLSATKPKRKSSAFIEFSIFDGVEDKSLAEVKMRGWSPKILFVADDNTFICEYTAEDTSGLNKDDITYSCLIRPNGGDLVKWDDNIFMLRAMSPSAKYVVGKEADDCFYVLRAEEREYSRAQLIADGWWIHDISHVTNHGQLFGIATCVDNKAARNRPYYRLRLPVMMTLEE